METNNQIVITKENLSDYTDIRGNINVDLPIKANVITDMRFDKEGKTWVGCSRTDKDGKIIVRLDTSTYKGIVAGAKHYYGRLVFTLFYANDGTKGIFWDAPKPKVPEEIELKWPLTEEFLSTQNTNDPYSDYYMYEAGFSTSRFENSNDLIDIAKAVFEFIFDKDDFVLEIDKDSFY